MFLKIIKQILNKQKIIVVKSSQKDKNLFKVNATMLAFILKFYFTLFFNMSIKDF